MLHLSDVEVSKRIALNSSSGSFKVLSVESDLLAAQPKLPQHESPLQVIEVVLKSTKTMKTGPVDIIIHTDSRDQPTVVITAMIVPSGEIER